MKQYAWGFLFFLGFMGCERSEPIPSAMRASIDRIIYSPTEEKFSTVYQVNFRWTSIDFTFFNGNQVCYQTKVSGGPFGSQETLTTTLQEMQLMLPAKLKCIMEVTTTGGDVIRDTSEHLNIGFLENTPMGNAANLLAFWPLAEDFEDYTLNQHHLKPTGSLLFGPIPNTLLRGTYFSNNAYLSRPHSAGLNPRALSISAYLYLDDLQDPADLHTLVSKRDFTGWGSSFDFKVSKRAADGFKVSVSWSIKGVNGYYESAANIPFKKASHIVYVHDENVVQIWVNGIKTDEIPSPGLLSNDNNLPLCVGTRPGVRHSLTGYLRDVGIWARALNEQEIQAMAALYP